MESFVSIVVSAFNRQQLLQRSFESLWANTNYPYELIVHDDGSQEETSAYLCKMLQQGKISTLIQNPPGHNRGLGISVNRAVHISEGQYIVKANGDDEFKPGWLLKAVQVMQIYPEIGLLHLAAYDYSMIYNDRFPDDYWAPGEDRTTLYRETRNGIPIRVVWTGPGDGLMFTREIWQRAGPWHHAYDPAFGADVSFRLACCPMARQLLQPEALKPGQLAAHWEAYKDTPWLAMMDPAVIDFSWGDGLTIVDEARKTLKHGPLLLWRL